MSITSLLRDAPDRLLGRQTVTAAAIFAAVFLSSLGAMELAKGNLLIAGFWPANAIALVALLRVRAQGALRWRAWFAAAAALVASNYVNDGGLRNSIVFILANLAEIATAYLLIRIVTARREKSGKPRSAFALIGSLVVAAVLSPAVGASIAATGLAFGSAPNPAQVWLEWWLPSALGLLIIGPLGLLVAPEDIRRLVSRRNLRDVLIGVIFILAVLLMVLLTHRLAMIMLAIPIVAVAAVRLRSAGVALSVTGLTLAFVPLVATDFGANYSMWKDVGERLCMMQGFLVIIGAAGLAGVALLEQRDGVLRELDQQRADASAMAQARLRLLLSVAHEIRTPLSVIQGCNEMLAQPGSLSPRQLGLLEAATAASRELQTLANDLLEAARAENGHLTIEPVWFAPKPLLEQVVAQIITASITVHPPVITIDAADNVFADPQRFRQIALNLMSNAAKYAGSYGPIRVSVRRTASTVILAVCDQGPGVPLGRERTIFEPFANATGPVTSTSAGFGLSVIRQLVEAHGGTVSCTSVPFIETRIEASFPLPGATARPALAPKDLASIDPASLFGV